MGVKGSRRSAVRACRKAGGRPRAGRSLLEQAAGGGLALQKPLAELCRDLAKPVQGTDGAVESRCLVSPHEPEELAFVDSQAIQNRRLSIRNAAALAGNDRAAGPVDELQVVLERIGQ